MRKMYFHTQKLLKLNNKINISDSILINQAKKFGEQLGISDLEFSYSKGWQEKFKSRFKFLILI